MKLRTIILLLSLLAFLSTITGGYFYYTAIKNSAADKNKTQLMWHAEAMRDRFENQIKMNQRAARALSEYEEIRSALTKLDQNSLNAANQVLERFNASLETDVSYLMDRDGKTIASSNHNDPDSFVDKNYSFRPYFQKAIQGTSFVYMALGVTTGKRGIYFSYPVYPKDQNPPLGVIVMKSSVDILEKEILRLQFNSPEMQTFIISPNGVIFMSNRDKYLFQLFEKISDDKIAAIVELKQFGDKPLKWSGFEQKNDSTIVDAAGDGYIMMKKKLSTLPNWQVVHLHNMDIINNFVYAPLSGKIGAIIISLCVIIGLSVAILYAIAQRGIIRRKAAEDAIVERENFLSSLLRAMPIPVFYKDRAGIYKGFNDAYEVFFGKSRDQLIGKTVFDISPKELAQIYHAKDTELFDSGGIQHYESKVKNSKNEMRDVIFDKSIYTDNNGKILGLIGTVSDITVRKQIEKEHEKLIDELQSALAEIKTLKGIVPICSKCKKIRDDEGYWNILESYIQKHSDALFSHSICPECSEKLYGKEDWYIAMNQSKEKKDE